jgi:hypothetical protein
MSIFEMRIFSGSWDRGSGRLSRRQYDGIQA